MGAEGYIEIARIADGHHLLTEDDPSFIVKEPVAIVPVSVGRLGKYPVLQRSDFGHYDVDNAEIVGLPDGNYPGFAIEVLTRKDFDRFFEAKKRDAIQKGFLKPEAEYYDFPGSVSPSQTKKAWEQIVPGYWIVTNYYSCGCGDDAFCFWLPEQRFAFGAKVKWEIWT